MTLLSKLWARGKAMPKSDEGDQPSSWPSWYSRADSRSVTLRGWFWCKRQKDGIFEREHPFGGREPEC